jgi:hypothetical protein
MITSINEYKKKLDKVGKEDIDINNDGKVDKSDFFLLGRRRKIKKAIKDKKNENNGAMSNYSKAMQIFYDFNLLTELMDEGYLNNDTLQLNDGVTLEDINDSKPVGEPAFENMEQYSIFMDRCKKYLDVQ